MPIPRLKCCKDNPLFLVKPPCQTIFTRRYLLSAALSDRTPKLSDPESDFGADHTNGTTKKISRYRTDLPRNRCHRIHPQHRQIYLIPRSKTFNSTMNDPSRLLPEEELHCQNTLLPLQAPVLKFLLPKGFHCSVSHG